MLRIISISNYIKYNADQKCNIIIIKNVEIIMLEIETEKNHIRLRNSILHISKVVEIDNAQNFNNINVLLESAFCGLLNIIEDGSQYKNLNTHSDNNHPGVDLGDHNKLSYYQVTSTASQRKVNKSYEIFLKNKPDNSDVYCLKFLILKIKSRSSNVKLPENYNANAIKFNPKSDYIDLSGLLQMIFLLDSDRIEKCVQYLDKIVRDNQVEAADLDSDILKVFFLALGESIVDDTSILLPQVSFDELNVKEQRLGDFWSFVYGCYQTVILPVQERKFKRAYNRLDEGARSTIEGFLRYNSYKLLERYKNPEMAFKELKELVLKKVSPFPISHSELEQYLCMEIVFCNVFPNPIEIKL